MINAILFTPEDFYELQSILEAFGNFEAGKLQLARFRAGEPTSEEMVSMRNDWMAHRVREQIEHNGKAKAKYDALLEKILLEFRSRVAELTV